MHRSIMEQGGTFSLLTPIQQLIAIYLITNANHKDGVWIDARRGHEVNVKRGQLVVSTRGISSWFAPGMVTHQLTRTCIAKLEKLNFLTQQATHFYTVITLVNYGCYQSLGDEANTEVNTALTHTPVLPNTQVNNKQERTKKLKIKNDKNLKNIDITVSYGDFVKMTVKQHESLLKDLGQDEVQKYIERIDDWFAQDQTRLKRYSDHSRMVRTWKRKDDANPIVLVGRKQHVSGFAKLMQLAKEEDQRGASGGY